MANLYEDIPEYAAQARANEQKRRIAEAMMAQGMEAQTPYTSAGRYVVPMSWSQGLAKVAQAMLGAYGIRKSQEAEQALAKQLQDKQQQTVTAYQEGLQQGPSVVPPAPSPEGNASIDPEQRWKGPTDEQVTADRRNKLIQFLTNQYAPESAKQAAVLSENWSREDANSAANRELVRQNRLDELALRAEQLKATTENARLSIEQRAEAARMHDETLRAIAAMSAGAKNEPKAPAGYRYKDDGTLEQIPGGPADVKTKAQHAKEVAANKTVQSNLDAEIANIDKLIGPRKTDPTGKPVMTVHPGLNAAVGPVDVRLPTLLTDTANAEAAIESLQSKASINALRDVRSGGSQSIGQITEREWPRLESMKATLQMKQGDAQFPQSLWDYREELLRTKKEAEDALAASAAGDGGAGVTVDGVDQSNPLLR